MNQRNLIVFLIFITCSFVFSGYLTGTEKPELTFNWPSDCEFTVIDKAVKKGNKVKTRFTMKIESIDGGKRLRISHKKVDVLEINGVPLTAAMKEKMKKAIGSQEKMYADFIVGQKGEFIEIDNWEKTYKDFSKAINLLSKDKKDDPSFKKLLGSEFMKTFITHLVKNRWMVWVEAWAGVDLVEGESYEWESNEVVSKGFPVIKLKNTFSHLGNSDKHHGGVHLKSVSEPESEEIVKFIKELLTQINQKELDESHEKMFKNVKMRYKSKVEIITNPKTLEPFWIFSEKDFAISIPELGEQKGYESHEYRFLWPK